MIYLGLNISYKKIMKIKEGFILRQVAGSHIVIGVGGDAVDFNGMVTINDTGVFLWNLLEAGCTKEELLAKFLEEYDIDVETAKTDIAEFLTKLLQANILNLDG